MLNDRLPPCPECGTRMEQGFSHRNTSLSWVAAQKLKKFAFSDEDLNEAGLKKYLPSIVALNLSYLCPDCKIYMVDYSKSLSRAEANKLAASIHSSRPPRKAVSRWKFIAQLRWFYTVSVPFWLVLGRYFYSILTKNTGLFPSYALLPFYMFLAGVVLILALAIWSWLVYFRLRREAKAS